MRKAARIGSLITTRCAWNTLAIREQSPAKHLPSKAMYGHCINTIVIQARIVDEAGEERAGEAFLRGSQAGQAGGLIAIPVVSMKMAPRLASSLQRLPSQYFHIVLVVPFQQGGSVQPIGAFG
jgi:hypothetical protein